VIVKPGRRAIAFENPVFPAFDAKGPDRDHAKPATMWKFLERLFGRPESGSGNVDSVLQALDDGTSQRALPTLVCRTCGLKYTNTGTYLHGSPCPHCRPEA
jgi:hypothetical protein